LNGPILAAAARQVKSNGSLHRASARNSLDRRADELLAYSELPFLPGTRNLPLGAFHAILNTKARRLSPRAFAFFHSTSIDRSDVSNAL
jgi:hypothetical protein